MNLAFSENYRISETVIRSERERQISSKRDERWMEERWWEWEGNDIFSFQACA